MGYLCNKAEHRCFAPPGKVLVNCIKIYTESCTNCQASDEGVMVKLRGEKNVMFMDGVPCKTKTLDHNTTGDFLQTGKAMFDGTKDNKLDEQEKQMMGSCYEVNLVYRCSP